MPLVKVFYLIVVNSNLTNKIQFAKKNILFFGNCVFKVNDF